MLGRTKLKAVADGIAAGKTATAIAAEIDTRPVYVRQAMDLIKKDEHPNVKGMLVDSLAGMVGNWGLSNDEIAKRIPTMSTDHLLAVNALSSQRVLDAATISKK